MVLNGTRDTMQTDITALHQRVMELEQAHRLLQAEYNHTTKALQDSQALLADIVKRVPNAMAVFDSRMNYLLVSDRFLHDYNKPGQDVIGCNHYEVFPDIPQRWKDVHQRCLAGAIEENTDDGFERDDGSITYTRWECRPWYDAHGAIGGILVFTEVITEHKQIAATLRELSTPLIPIAENVVVMPLIGTIDSARAQQVMETLLEGIAHHQAALAILDITGVGIVDTQVANALIRAAQAAKLLGAQVLLTGIQPPMAQTLVHLGIDLSAIRTHGTLQAGIAYALAHAAQA